MWEAIFRRDCPHGKNIANAYMSAMQDQPRAARACPICSKPALEQFRPFCSKRCADVDLNRWLSGVYAVPVTELDDEDGEKPAEDPAAR